MHINKQNKLSKLMKKQLQYDSAVKQERIKKKNTIEYP
jgi:hypothetical protein